MKIQGFFRLYLSTSCPPPRKTAPWIFSHFCTIYSPSVALHCGTIHLPEKIRIVAMETLKVAKVSIFSVFWTFLIVFGVLCDNELIQYTM